MEIPEVFHGLLASKALALVSTIGKRGEPQATPLWFLWDGERVRFSLVEGRQKLLNLRREPRISVVVVEPTRPGFYLELRGRIDELVPDWDCSLERAVAMKYVGEWTDVEASGATRYATSILVERITSQQAEPS
ncbi:PPOX class F420-dependent oxidoreductase [Kribbella sancticallisti]|uniref:PPOX class F420-dependent oxidoreductase n=1 Tax=Kribbella sancticallisti TaxID=460087 RepID=A0ABN2C5F9_9ACTN